MASELANSSGERSVGFHGGQDVLLAGKKLSNFTGISQRARDGSSGTVMASFLW